MKNLLLSTLASALILFLWSGLTQVFPWGVPTAQTVSTQSPGYQTEAFQAPELIQLPAGSLTTAAFDERFVGRVSTLTTDQTFSWIVSKPLDYYQPGAYFMREALTQLLVGLLLAGLLQLTVPLPNRRRLGLVLIAALAGFVANTGPLLNWWGLPLAYGLGSGLNLVVGWLVAGFVSSRWIIKSQLA